MVLLPLQLRQVAGFEQVCEAITGPRCSAKMIQLMSQSLLIKDDEQPVRGYVVVSPEKGDLLSSVSFKVHLMCFLIYYSYFVNSSILKLKEKTHIEHILLRYRNCK